MTKERKEALDRYRGDLSYGEAVKRLLEKIDLYKKGRADGYARGYQVGCQEGRREGYSSGHSDGHSAGENEGIESCKKVVKELGEDSFLGMFSDDPE